MRQKSAKKRHIKRRITHAKKHRHISHKRYSHKKHNHKLHHKHVHKRTAAKKLERPQILIKVRDVLPPSDIKLNAEDTLQDAIKIFSKYQLSGAPVFRGRKLVGIVTTTDLTNFIDENGVSNVLGSDSKITVSKLMTKNPITIKADKTITEAITSMVKNKVSKLIVLDKQGKFLNVISRQDILKKIAFILSKPELTPSSEIETDIDDFYMMLVEKGSASAKYCAAIMKVDVDTVEGWAKALQEHGLINIEYSPFGGMKLKIKKRSGR
jgi:CBS domain-containing protein